MIFYLYSYQYSYRYQRRYQYLHMSSSKQFPSVLIDGKLVSGQQYGLTCSLEHEPMASRCIHGLAKSYKVVDIVEWETEAKIHHLSSKELLSLNNGLKVVVYIDSDEVPDEVNSVSYTIDFDEGKVIMPSGMMPSDNTSLQYFNKYTNRWTGYPHVDHEIEYALLERSNDVLGIGGCPLITVDCLHHMSEANDEYSLEA
jgi:hypothetical protein